MIVLPALDRTATKVMRKGVRSKSDMAMKRMKIVMLDDCGKIVSGSQLQR